LKIGSLAKLPNNRHLKIFNRKVKMIKGKYIKGKAEIIIRFDVPN
jgi:hypothetical protein